jgi:hypothetical protein
MLFTLQFHIGMNYCFSFQNHLEIFLAPQGYLSFLYFFNVLVLAQIKMIYCMFHIVSHHHYLLTKHYLHQSYFNMSYHWHMNMCCLINIHVNILTLFNRLLPKKHMSMQKVKMENCLLHLTCGKSNDKIILKLCMVFNLLYTYVCVS